MQLLVDLAQTLKDVAEAHGLTSQALRSAQIADSADSALRSAGGERGERGTERGPPRSAPGALHVSLQELYELKTLRVKIYEVEQAFKQHAEELESQLGELRQSFLGLSEAQVTERKALGTFREETLRDLGSLTALSTGAKVSLEDHEHRLSAVVSAEQEGREAAKSGLEHLKEEMEQKLQKKQSDHEEVLKKHSLQLVEIQNAFTSLETEILEVCAKDRNALQSKQQESLEQLAEVRHLSQQHYSELQEQFRSFQQLMLNKQWEAKQSTDAGVHDLRLRLHKVMWQRSDEGTATSLPSEPLTLIQEAEGSPVQRSPLQRSPASQLEEVRQNLEMKLVHVEEQLKRSIQRLSEDMAQKHRFVEVSLEKTLGASQVEERLTNRLEEGVRGIQYEFRKDLQAVKTFEHEALGELQSKVEAACKDAETSATQSRSTSKSLKLLEATVQDIKVSIDQNQSDVQDLRGEVSPLPQTVKRVDDLWRHFEGLKADVQQLDRSSKADVIALGEHLEAKVGSIRPRQSTGQRPTSSPRPVPPWTSEPVTSGAATTGRQRKTDGLCQAHWQRCVGESRPWP